MGKFRFPPEEYVRLVRDGSWSVVHLHGQRVWSTDHLYRHLARVRSPTVFTAHGFYQWHMERTPLLDAYYYHRLLPRALRHIDAVTALTGAERDELASWGVDAGRLHVIPDGLDVAEFASLPSGFRKRHDLPADAPFLLYVGGFYRNKRVDRLVGAAHRAGAPLVVIGRDAHGERATCEALARQRGADVRFLGALPREDVLAAYRDASLFLLGSDFEGFALVLLEAMASGLPFVATRAGAAPDLARHGAGVSVAPEALGDAARDLLRDAEGRARMAEKGKDSVRAYDWSAIARRYLALYEEVA